MNEQISIMMHEFDKLDLESKKNEFSDLMYKTNEILNTILTLRSCDSMFKTKELKNIKDSEKSEDEIISFMYEDLWKIKNNASLLLTLISMTGDNINPSN